MTTALRERQVPARADDGGVPARRAVIRWAWRLFRREWRQQLLILGLIVVAVAATFVGAAVATDTPPPAGASVPVNLLIILVGMPLVAAVAGWLLAGREPPAIAHQPIE
jgi:hypothetical protein